MVNLANKRFTILGLQGSGKSTFAKWIVKQNPKALVFDTVKEYPNNVNRYIPVKSHGPTLVDECERCIERLLLKNKRFDMFVIDEANRIAPSKKPLPPNLGALNDQNRHYGIALGMVARRPTQLHTDFLDLAHFLFIFQLSGPHDVMALERIEKGLGNAAKTLPPYHFLLVNENRQYQVMPPIKP